MKTITIEEYKGTNGSCLVINNTRITTPKIYGMLKCTKRFTVDIDELENIIKYYKENIENSDS